MKIFYCVMVERYTDGTVKASARARGYKTMPKDHVRKIQGMEARITWYEDITKAIAALNEARGCKQ
jgi:hypothetical protein